MVLLSMSLLWGCAESPNADTGAAPPAAAGTWTYGTGAGTTSTVPTGSSTPSTPSTTPSTTTTPTTSVPTTPTTPSTTTTTPSTTTTTAPEAAPCPPYSGVGEEGLTRTMHDVTGDGVSISELVQVTTLGDDTTVVWEMVYTYEAEPIEDYVYGYVSTYRCDADGMWLESIDVEGSYTMYGVVYETWSVTEYDDYLAVPYGMGVGARWSTFAPYTQESSSGSREGVVATESVVVRAEALELPAGTFDTLEVEVDNNGYIYSHWTEPDLGLVATEHSELWSFAD